MKLNGKTTLIGFLFVIGGFALVFYAMRQMPVEKMFVWVGLGTAVFGAGIMIPDAVFGALERGKRIIRKTQAIKPPEGP